MAPITIITDRISVISHNGGGREQPNDNEMGGLSGGDVSDDSSVLRSMAFSYDMVASHSSSGCRIDDSSVQENEGPTFEVGIIGIIMAIILITTYTTWRLFNA